MTEIKRRTIMKLILDVLYYFMVVNEKNFK